MIITRFPPSPTGNFHAGSARTALFNYLYAKHTGGKMMFRLEDTDTERSKPEYRQNILDGLSWLGITFDGEIVVQSERKDLYRTYLEKIIASGHAYRSEEKALKEGDRTSVIRLKNPNKDVVFEDLVRGTITVHTSDLGDIVIAKDMETPLYHFAVVVDDHEMGITHVIRGEDGIANTPRQILIQEALEIPRPIYAHIPFIVAPDRSKLSKRHGAVAVTEYREQGYLPEALLNFLALIGWNPGTTQELFSLEELILAFTLEKVQQGSGAYSAEKLDWMNKEYLKKMSIEEFYTRSRPYLPDEMNILMNNNIDVANRLIPIIRERITKFGDIIALWNEGEFGYFFIAPKIDTSKIVWKDASVPETIEHLTYVASVVNTLTSTFPSSEDCKAMLWGYATEKGRGSVLWPLRYALSGKDKSPDPFTLLSLLGKDESLNRITHAISILSSA